MTRARSTWWYPALAGVAAVAAGLGVGEVVAAIVDPRSSPLVAVGGLVIDRVPESGKDLAIRLFGTNDKLALQVGTVVLLNLICAALGVLARRRRWVGFAGFAALGGLAIVAALTRAGASVEWALPGLVAAGTGVALLGWFLRQIDSFTPPEDAAAERTADSAADRTVTGGDDRTDGDLTGTAAASRRLFLRGSALALGGGALVGWLGRWLGSFSVANTARDEVAVELPTPSGGPAPAVPEADVADLRYVTPNERFYRIDTALVVPRINPAEWTLTIDGRVRRPLTLTFDELLSRPMVERYITLTCVSNPVGGDLIGNARWLGVPIADLLDEVDPDPAADQVVSWSVDGFTAGTPTAALRDGRDALLAVGMNGEPLPFDHGFPVRMVVPGLYGYVSATKWLRRLELTTFDAFDAYWIPRGWAQQAPIKTQSRIDRPRPGQRIEAGEYLVAGVAWAQHRGISAVQVRVDGGPWQDATLAAVASIDTWRLWSWRWMATPGDHTLEVRAADNAGVFQTADVAPPIPDGATGYHRISVQVH
ncbi:MAG: molybdopterin-dependent oxidoreductase [Micromonosporaceae bacterium]|nr:molybdopterin-dependent oxidoreductase [Micromonosporaceae bacterium]